MVILEGATRFTDLLLAPGEGFDQGFFPLGKKREFNVVCAYFKPFLVFSSNLVIKNV